MLSRAPTVAGYLRALDPDRRRTVAAIRRAIRANLPSGYAERMNWGMISYEIPLWRYPDTYNGRPLSFVALAAQKHGCSLYLMHAYQHSAAARRIAAAFRRAGKPLAMGKCCIRFRSIDDLELGAILDTIRATPPAALIAMYEKARRRR